MKLKAFIASLAAVLAIAGCTKENQLYLDEVQVSSSYVSIPVDGGSSTITVTATGSWTISNIPDWMTVSPTSGSAGETKVTFSAESTLDGREGSVNLTCGDAVQIVNYIQGLAVVSPATCAEVIAGPDSKSYQVTGICTAIANTTYGNFYLNDGTGSIYIYGTVDASGSYNWSTFDIEVGDEVTVKGPKTTYNGTVELVDAEFVSVNKSLIKVEMTDPEDGNMPSDGGLFTVTLTNKGEGIIAEVPEDAESWLSIASINGNEVTFKVAANTGKSRSTTLVFETTKSGKSYTAETTLNQDGLTGTLETPFTVSEAIDYALTLSGDGPKDMYVKGVVSKVVYSFSANYGTATFWISDDGVYNSDTAKDFEAYSVYFFDNKAWAEGDPQIEVGANVILCGKLTNYKGTAETSSKKAYVYSINGQTTAANGIGTKTSPLNIKGAVAYCSTLSGNTAGDVWVEGTVCELTKYNFGASYNTASFYLSDDGTTSGDKFEAYTIYYMNNSALDSSISWPENGTVIAVGQKIVLCGKLTKYGTTCETASRKAYIYSIDGKTE